MLIRHIGLGPIMLVQGGPTAVQKKKGGAT
jgi:hypothetical protein